MISYRKEACVESFSEALLAWERKADRLEICSHLELDGLTPSPEMVGIVVNAVEIPVKVMIRPRSGNFIYNDAEIKQMCECIARFKEINIAGFVLGALTPEGKIDEKALQTLITAVGEIPITFHKAIDLTTSLLDSVNVLRKYPQVKYILTSGGADNAFQGIPMLKKMQEQAEWDLEIIPAGSITDENIEALHQELDFQYYHGRRIVGKLE
ncbi:MAG: copper homeostasis protein CutC [Candidatus Cloacimonetes bacterium]|nr:copper homeostasis protein CutC [Candidatus Cloacimonadota bacterium]